LKIMDFMLAEEAAQKAETNELLKMMVMKLKVKN